MDSRPLPNIQKTKFDSLLENIALVAIIANIILVGYNYSALPEIIPTHFDINGTPDGFGNRILILLLPTIGAMMYIGMRVLNYYPHKFNYIIQITETNAQFQYQLAQSLIRKLNMLISMTFLYLSAESVYFSLNNLSFGIGMPVFTVIMGSILSILIYYFYQSGKKSTA